MTTESKIKTRPCKPGDVLAQCNAQCGAFCQVVVAKPTSHPESGTTNDHTICLSLFVCIPCNADSRHYLPHKYFAPIRVLDEMLHDNWGIYRGEAYPLARYQAKHFDGANIAALVTKLITLGKEALAAIQAIVDAHENSRNAQESARNAAYAGWQVQDLD